ncbi:BgTH12-05103 [Blumeria graminis f. sp. triticale]|uniref:BgTH12-05101 n=1 Tax=Blumeria graminis f. sp. triticale TaxID=1689686 RepID=A0A9W4DM68_BLUGR|nr:BgTH12-05101 [Blumeria graminis f. sp. triticale]CAD6502511.1 BgTH12-05103 [Blumeria graminis f. sp. triticale]
MFAASPTTHASWRSYSSYSNTSYSDPSSSSSASSPICAFPSWPRRSSLNSDDHTMSNYSLPSNSFITDEELFPPDKHSPIYAPPISPMSMSPASITQEETLRRSNAARVHVHDKNARDLVRELVELEKAKRGVLKRRKSSGASKKSRSGSGASKYMSPITE